MKHRNLQDALTNQRGIVASSIVRLSFVGSLPRCHVRSLWWASFVVTGLTKPRTTVPVILFCHCCIARRGRLRSVPLFATPTLGISLRVCLLADFSTWLRIEQCLMQIVGLCAVRGLGDWVLTC